MPQGLLSVHHNGAFGIQDLYLHALHQGAYGTAGDAPPIPAIVPLVGAFQVGHDTIHAIKAFAVQVSLKIAQHHVAHVKSS